MTSRNAPCPCGSGRKFKRCHGKSSEEERTGARPLSKAIQALEDRQPEEALRLAGLAEDSVEKSRLLVHLLIQRRQTGDLDRAKKELDQWRLLKPADPEPLQRQIEIHLFEDERQKALISLGEIKKLLPGHPTLFYLQAVLAQLGGELDKALSNYAEAITVSEGSRSVLFSSNEFALRVAAAMQLCETAAGNYPGANRVQQQGMFECSEELRILENNLLAWEAQTASQHSKPSPELRKKFSDAWYNLGSAAQAAYTHDDRRVRLFQKAIELNPKHLKARLGEVFSLNYSPDLTPRAIFEMHRENGQWLQQEFGQTVRNRQFTGHAGKRLRIGYLSSDFRAHSVAHFILPVLERHDRSNFELYLYYNHGSRDALTSRFERLADHFRLVHSLSDADLYRAIVEDQIDILFDLNGLSEHNRIAVLCQRPSPLQINWIGYPNTTGLETVDYRIVDEITDPPQSSSKLATEELIRMPNTFSIYQAPDDLPEPGPLPSLSRGFVTFGSFNSMPKLNDALVQSWCSLLMQNSSSRILVKNIALGFAEPRRQLLEVFEKFGIEPERVDLRGATPGQREHFQTISEVDISLDSFPYNGTTTTCDCLMMGVPVVSRAGKDHRSRVSASHLAALQLESLVGRNDNACIEIASELARDQQRLEALRAELPDRMRASALMDAEGFTREFEARLKLVWSKRIEKQL